MNLRSKIALLAAILAFTFPATSSPASAIGPSDDAIAACAHFNPTTGQFLPARPSQFVKIGRLSGHDAAALVMCNGGSGAGSSVLLFVNFGAQVGGTRYLGEIVGGNQMNVFFAGDYAYVTSALHGPMFTPAGKETHDSSACNQCYTRMLVQRLSTREGLRQHSMSQNPGPLIKDNGIAIVDVSGKSNYRYYAEHADFKASVLWDGKLLLSKQLIRHKPLGSPEDSRT